jgi:Capsule assembly protein Wzi
VAWGARPFGPDELAELLRDSPVTAHPWGAALSDAVAPRAALGASVFASVNSGFPWGANDGALWQGRGVSAAISAGAAFRLGPVSFVAAPLAFRAQNGDFRLMVQQRATRNRFQDALFPNLIDLPQRMGDGSYSRVDPGESSLRLRLGPVTATLSTASVGWGIGESFPAILGSNAGGFPRFAVSTSQRGLMLPHIGRISAQAFVGLLSQTQWSPVVGGERFVNRAESGTKRVGSGLSVSLMPHVLPDLELGATRFFHSAFIGSENAWRLWSRPFQGLLKKSLGTRIDENENPVASAENQLASLFARWTLPHRGVEVAFELLREDHNWDQRDLAQEPENNAAIIASAHVVTRRHAEHLSVLTLEYFDGDVRPIAQARPQGFLYEHDVLRQGHTQRGQLLGSPIGVGAIAGQRIAWEDFKPAGSTRIALQRWRTRSALSADPELLFRPPNAALAGSHDWMLDLMFGISRRKVATTVSIDVGVAWAGRWQLQESNYNAYARSTLTIF